VAKGLTTGEVQAHLAEIYGAQVGACACRGAWLGEDQAPRGERPVRDPSSG